jgi:hypothetical protein
MNESRSKFTLRPAKHLVALEDDLFQEVAMDAKLTNDAFAAVLDDIVRSYYKLPVPPYLQPKPPRPVLVRIQDEPEEPEEIPQPGKPTLVVLIIIGAWSLLCAMRGIL